MPRYSGRANKAKRLKVEGGGEEGASSVKGESSSKKGRGARAVAVEGGVVAGVEDGALAGTSSSASNSMSQGRAVENPLENAVILHHLFEICPAGVLATCRQVCKQWYDESLVTWRNSFRLTFTVRNGWMFLTNRCHKPKALSLRLQRVLEFMEEPQNQCSTKPYRSIKLVDCELSLSQDQAEAFWNVFGSNLTTLELGGCEFKNVEDFRKIIFKCCPNLRRLIINECSFPDRAADSGSRVLEYTKPFYGEHTHLRILEVYRGFEVIGPGWYNSANHQLPISWLELFSHFQSLVSLIFCSNTVDGGSRVNILPESDLESLLGAIRIVRAQDRKKLNFKSFFVSPPLQVSRDVAAQEKLNLVRQLRLPMDALIMEIHPDLDEDFLRDTLNFHAKKVKTIRLDEGAPHLMAREFPFELQLNNLTHFSIEDKLCESFTFLKYTPNLKSLNVSVARDSNSRHPEFETHSEAVTNTRNMEMEHVKMLRLTKLNLGCIVSDEDIVSLYQWMPNVRELKMILNDRQFGIICNSEDWSNLRKLFVYGYELTDVGITGKSKREVKRKRKVAGPNIAYLKNLEKFSFWSSNLTSDSVFYGFLELPNLQRIKSLRYGALRPWGKPARDALRKRKIELRERSGCGCCW